MGFFDWLLGRKKKQVPSYKPMEKPDVQFVLIGKEPKKQLNRMIGYAFLGDKIENESELSRRLSGVRMYYKDTPYTMIRTGILGNPKVLLLHSEVSHLAEKLKKDYPGIEVHDLGYPRSYKKFKKQVQELQ